MREIEGVRVRETEGLGVRERDRGVESEADLVREPGEVRGTQGERARWREGERERQEE